MGATVVWFRQDLRLDDNPAVRSAVRHGGSLIPVYIWAPHEEGAWPPGAASRWWLHHSLLALQAELRKRGSRLIVRAGDSLTALSEIIGSTGADHVVWNARYEPSAVQRDAGVRDELTRRGIRVDALNGSLLFDVAAIRNRQGQPFQVFTPFWETCLRLDPPATPAAAPRQLAAPKRWPTSCSVDSLGLLPRIDWTSEIAATWKPGENSARQALQRFVRLALARYGEDRDRPAVPGTSRLSPHLHWGEVSPRRVWHAVRTAAERPDVDDAGGEAYLRELGWREFAHHLLWHYPHTPEQPLRGKFADVPWEHNEEHLRAWQRARTGYPLVDAGMRQLWRTGWMHNRVRMVVGSFLVKHLLISWQEGARWFWDTLVDADLANNTLGWQWVAGCGADAAPYFRVFNPTTQAAKFDPDHAYIERYVPEAVSDSAGGLFSRDIRGAEYPRPIVDHAFARQRFLSAMARLVP